MLKIALTFAVTFLFMLSTVYAKQQGGSLPTLVNDEIISGNRVFSAGVTPDSPLYFFDTLFDRLQIALTTDPASKARLDLDIARERLLESRTMLLQNKTDAAAVAQSEHEGLIRDVETSVSVLRRPNSTQTAEDVIDIERELEEHEEEVETVANDLKIKIEVKGNFTPRLKETINIILDRFANATGEVKMKIENKKGELKVKIKTETGESEEKVEQKIREIETRKDLTTIQEAKAREQIAEAGEEINETSTKLNQVNRTLVNVTAVNTLLNEAKEKFQSATVALEQEKFGEAFGQATAAEKLAKNAEKILEQVLGEEKEERKIEVEIEKDKAEVKIKISGVKTKFTLGTTDTTEIFSEISQRTGLSIEEVKKITKIKIEEEKEEKKTERSEVSKETEKKEETNSSDKRKDKKFEKD